MLFIWSQIQTGFPWHFLLVRQDHSQLSSLSLAQHCQDHSQLSSLSLAQHCQDHSQLSSLSLAQHCQAHSQLSSLSLAQHWLTIILHFFYQGKSNAHWLPLRSMLWAATISYSFLTRQHQIDGLHIEKQSGAVSLAQMLSLVRYIEPLVNWRKIMKPREMKRSIILFFFLVIFWGWKPGFTWHP
jgi:hypothetical protein